MSRKSKARRQSRRANQSPAQPPSASRIIPQGLLSEALVGPIAKRALAAVRVLDLLDGRDDRGRRVRQPVPPNILLAQGIDKHALTSILASAKRGRSSANRIVIVAADNRAAKMADQKKRRERRDREADERTRLVEEQLGGSRPGQHNGAFAE